MSPHSQSPPEPHASRLSAPARQTSPHRQKLFGLEGSEIFFASSALEQSKAYPMTPAVLPGSLQYEGIHKAVEY
jgi:hypothetical protein